MTSRTGNASQAVSFEFRPRTQCTTLLEGSSMQLYRADYNYCVRIERDVADGLGYEGRLSG